jgi:hypothetical protein
MGHVIRINVNKKLEIVGDARQIAFKGNVFDLDAVDRVAYRSVALRIDGAYMGTSFWVRLGQGTRADQFVLDSKSHDRRLDEFRSAWYGLVDFLEARACPRIGKEAIATISSGGTVAFGSIVAGPDGVRARRPLARMIPWREVAGTAVDNQGMHVLVRRNGSEPKAKLLAGLEQWNTVVLPRVVDHLAGT